MAETTIKDDECELEVCEKCDNVAQFRIWKPFNLRRSLRTNLNYWFYCYDHIRSNAEFHLNGFDVDGCDGRKRFRIAKRVWDSTGNIDLNFSVRPPKKTQ